MRDNSWQHGMKYRTNILYPGWINRTVWLLIKGRVLRVEEVGHAFDQSLKHDKNGACYVVFPDCPPFLMPYNNMETLKVMVGFGHYLGVPLGLETFNGKHVIIALSLMILFAYMVFCLVF